MLDSLLTLLAAKAKAAALVAGTALATTAAVGGGTVAYQGVGDDSAPPDAVAADDSALARAVAADRSATSTARIGVGKGNGNGAQHRSATATAVLTGNEAAPKVTFTCDPARNHGQNVSTYVHSLPKGPGRGPLVSQAARSDCGKELTATKSADPRKTRPAKPAKALKPAKPAKAGASARPGKPSAADRAGKAAKPRAPKPSGSAGARNGHGKERSTRD